MSCPHGNPIGDCDICDEIDAAFEAGRRSALAEQPAPAQPLTDEEIIDKTRWVCVDMRWPSTVLDIARAIEQAHGICEEVE